LPRTWAPDMLAVLNVARVTIEPVDTTSYAGCMRILSARPPSAREGPYAYPMHCVTPVSTHKGTHAWEHPAPERGVDVSFGLCSVNNGDEH